MKQRLEMELEAITELSPLELAFPKQCLFMWIS